MVSLANTVFVIDEQHYKTHLPTATFCIIDDTLATSETQVVGRLIYRLASLEYTYYKYMGDR